MTVNDTTQINRHILDMHCAERDLNLKDCTLSLILRVKGGKLMISQLPDFPPIYCTQDGCDELSEYLVSILLSNGDRLDCFQCETHKKRLIALGEAEIPIEITH